MLEMDLLQACLCFLVFLQPPSNERRTLTGWNDLCLFCFCCCLLQSLPHALGGRHACLRSFHFWPEHHDHRHADTGQDLKVPIWRWSRSFSRSRRCYPLIVFWGRVCVTVLLLIHVIFSYMEPKIKSILNTSYLTFYHFAENDVERLDVL